MIKKVKYFIFGLGVGLIALIALVGGGVLTRLGYLPFVDRFVPQSAQEGTKYVEKKVLKEESVVIDVAEKTSPSVVTVSISKTEQVPLFGFFGLRTEQRQIEQDIGSGFVVEQGLIVTNRHVVSDQAASYRILTKDEQVYEVQDIYRDPVNDLAILKIDADIQPLVLGDSDQIKVGQLAIAIGTALGEYRHTVTTGVISGLGRGVTAGSPLQGYVEELDNVIQTDAAINPGNSGGPLLNSAGQVIGVNVAVAGGAENIGFALPINVVKESLQNFEQTGEFDRPFLGVEYQIISERSALLNEVPQGAYIRGVVSGSSADQAGLQEGDIITHLDGQRITEDGKTIAEIINQKRVGEQIEIEYWQDGETIKETVQLGQRD
jgi:S1-C subfamily serine protease